MEAVNNEGRPLALKNCMGAKPRGTEVRAAYGQPPLGNREQQEVAGGGEQPTPEPPEIDGMPSSPSIHNAIDSICCGGRARAN